MKGELGEGDNDGRAINDKKRFSPATPSSPNYRRRDGGDI